MVRPVRDDHPAHRARRHHRQAGARWAARSGATPRPATARGTSSARSRRGCSTATGRGPPRSRASATPARCSPRGCTRPGTRSSRSRDSKIALYAEDGIDVPAARAAKADGALKANGAKEIAPEELLALDVDLLCPSALENAITDENAGDVRASDDLRGRQRPGHRRRPTRSSTGNGVPSSPTSSSTPAASPSAGSSGCRTAPACRGAPTTWPRRLEEHMVARRRRSGSCAPSTTSRCAPPPTPTRSAGSARPSTRAGRADAVPALTHRRVTTRRASSAPTIAVTTSPTTPAIASGESGSSSDAPMLV